MRPGVPAPTTDEYPTESYSAWSCPNFGDIYMPGTPTADALVEVPVTIRHVYVWPERILTVNELIRTNWRPAATFTAEWREAFKLMSKGCAPLAWCHITVRYIHGSNRKMDVGAEALAVKAAIDGIVDGGVLVDDSPAYVRSVTYLPATYLKGEERLIVTLEGRCA